jgi:hypothetical protein
MLRSSRFPFVTVPRGFPALANSPGIANVLQGKVCALSARDRFPKEVIVVVDNSGALVC